MPRCCCAYTSTRERISTAGFKSKAGQRSVGDTVSEGQRIFERTACVNCHTVAGTPANGTFGPDLTHLMSRQTIAAGAATNTLGNLMAWIYDPAVIKPGCKMPAMGLSTQQAAAVAEYLETLR